MIKTTGSLSCNGRKNQTTQHIFEIRALGETIDM